MLEQMITQLVIDIDKWLRGLIVAILASRAMVSPLATGVDGSVATKSKATGEPSHFVVEAGPKQSPVASNQVVVTVKENTPNSIAPQTQGEANYQLEADPGGEEGFFVMKSAPSETMSKATELNAAVNQYRVNHNLNGLYIDPQICEIATQRAVEIDSHFSHDGFNTHFENGDYDYTGFSVIGENLWQGSFSGVHIVEFGWDQSAGHRANLQGDWHRGCAGIYGINATFVFVK